MLLWVGADVAGNALVVWEAEAGAVAQDPIAALAMAGAGSVAGRGLSLPPLTPLPTLGSLSSCSPHKTSSRIPQITNAAKELAP